MELAFLYGRVRYGIDLGAASAANAVARDGAPILLIHGTDDENTPPRHAEMIRAANPGRVSMWLVPGATHSGPAKSAAIEYRVRIMNFLAVHRSVRP